MKYMYFHNGIFNKGRHITVRRGDQWHRSVKPGEILALVDVETGSYSFTGKVLGMEMIKFDKIPEDMLVMSSNPQCKSKEDLLNNMRSIYSEFEPEEEVTVIFFEVE